jgi:hypothetical protein
MSCWVCEKCGSKVCDQDECPTCIKKASKKLALEKRLGEVTDSDYKGFINDRL